MESFSEDKAKEKDMDQEKAPLDSLLPEVKEEANDDSHDYHYSYSKSMKSVSRGGEAKTVITQKIDDNGEVKTTTEEFSNPADAKNYYETLHHGHQDRMPQPVSMPVMELDGVEISANTSPINDLLVFADHIDKLGHEELADRLFLFSQKIEKLFSK